MHLTPPVVLRWLPAEQLGSAQIEPRLRHWLIGQGLLSERLRSVGGEKFSLQLVEQFTGLLDSATQMDLGTTDKAGLFREVALEVAEITWVYAQTIIPDETLSRHPWLAELGDAPLGETIRSMSGLERRPFEFAKVPADHSLAERAMTRSGDRSDWLWARRALYRLRGAPFIVQELFCPGIGQAGARAN